MGFTNSSLKINLNNIVNILILSFFLTQVMKEKKIFPRILGMGPQKNGISISTDVGGKTR